MSGDHDCGISTSAEKLNWRRNLRNQQAGTNLEFRQYFRSYADESRSTEYFVDRKHSLSFINSFLVFENICFFLFLSEQIDFQSTDSGHGWWSCRSLMIWNIQTKNTHDTAPIAHDMWEWADNRTITSETHFDPLLYFIFTIFIISNIFYFCWQQLIK